MRRARLRSEPLAPYRPQNDFLQLLNLGDGTAIAAKWRLALRGQWLARGLTLDVQLCYAGQVLLAVLKAASQRRNAQAAAPPARVPAVTSVEPRHGSGRRRVEPAAVHLLVSHRCQIAVSIQIQQQ